MHLSQYRHLPPQERSRCRSPAPLSCSTPNGRRTLGTLLQDKLPRIHKHLVKHNCEVSIVATDWYLCLFATSMPSETVARIWDSLLYEGPKVIYRVALASLKMHQTVVLKKDNAGGASAGSTWLWLALRPMAVLCCPMSCRMAGA
jgi:hypothetical protein